MVFFFYIAQDQESNRNVKLSCRVVGNHCCVFWVGVGVGDGGLIMFNINKSNYSCILIGSHL